MAKRIDEALRFHCERRGWSLDVALYVATGNPVSAVARPLEFERHEDGTLNDQPALTMRDEDAQALVDALWQAGFRPTQGKQSEGVTAAQAKHLEDMRALTFAKLNVTKPEGE